MIDSGNLFRTNPVLQFLDKGEAAILCLLLATMIILSCVQIILRTFFAGGLLWVDPLLRYLVLWCGLLGAVTATGQGRHIALDITGKRLPKRVDAAISLVSYIFCILAASGLTWAGYRFLQSEIEFGGAGPLSLPLWFWSSIFPVAFGLITIKYVLLFIINVKLLLSSVQQKGRTSP